MIKININENELVQYIIINKDLGMSSGKVAAQVGHVCTICAVCQQDKEIFNEWLNGNQKKIILQAHQNVLDKLENECFSIRDVGRNEVEPNSLTAISLGVRSRRDAESIVKRLQVYK